MKDVRQYDQEILVFIKRYNEPVNWYNLRYRDVGPYEKVPKALRALAEKGLLTKISDEHGGIYILSDKGEHFLETYQPTEDEQ